MSIPPRTQPIPTQLLAPLAGQAVPLPKKQSAEVRITLDPRKIRFADDELSCEHFFRNARVKLRKEDMGTLREHIRLHGLLHMLTVRPYRVPNTEGWTHECILGSRRLRCIQGFLEMATVEVLDKRSGNMKSASEVYTALEVNCRDCDDEEAIALSLGENLERDNLDDLDLMGFCKELSNLKLASGEPKFTRDQIARLCNRSSSWVSLTLKLDELPAAIKELMERRRLTRTAALSLLQTKPTHLLEVIAKAQELVRGEASKEEAAAQTEESEARNEVEDCESDIAVAAMLGRSATQTTKRLDQSMRRVRHASDRRKAAQARATEGQITQDHINTANVLVPGAKKGAAKSLPFKVIRQKLADHKKNNIIPHDDDSKRLIQLGVEAALEWALGRRFASDIPTLLNDIAEQVKAPIAS